MPKLRNILLKFIAAIILILLISCEGADSFKVNYIQEELKSHTPKYTVTHQKAEVICDLWEDGCNGAGPNPSKRIFIDSFNDGYENPDWELDGWNVVNYDGNYVLEGVGHAGAAVHNHDAKNFAFRAKFKRDRGGIHFSFRSDGSHRYFVGVDANSLALTKQLGSNFIHLAKTDLNYVDWNKWHKIEIRAIEDEIRVFIDGTRCICYSDSDPISSKGVIWLETLDNSDFYIDEVSISI